MQLCAPIVYQKYPLIAPMPILISPQMYWLCYCDLVPQLKTRPWSMTTGNKIIAQYDFTSHQLLLKTVYLIINLHWCIYNEEESSGN